MSLPSNAEIRQLATPGVPKANGDAGPPVAIWSGKARGYLTTLDRVTSSNVYRDPELTLEDLARTPVLVIALRRLRAAGIPIPTPGAPWVANSLVLIDRRSGGSTQTRYTVDGTQVHSAGTVVDDVVLQLSHPRAA